MSENAQVTPDPKTISDWYSDQVFRVESHSGTYHSFIYRLEQTDNSFDKEVVLTTQADVDAFPKLGINRIAGNLIIGTAHPTETDIITNLDGLNGLQEVTRNLIIHPSFHGTTLDGLSNLKKAGSIYIGTPEEEAQFEVEEEKLALTLPQLSSLGSLMVRSNHISHIRLPELVEVGAIHIQSQMLQELDLSALKICHGTFTLNGSQETSDGQYGNALNKDSANSLLLALSLPELTQVEGDFNLVYLWNTSTLKLPLLQKVGGHVNINTIKNITKMDFPALKSVQGKLKFYGNDGLTKLYLNALEQTNDLYIASLNEWSINLKELELNRLAKVNQNLVIKYAAIETLSLPLLESIGGSFDLNEMQFIEQLVAPTLEKTTQINFIGLNLLTQIQLNQLKQVEEVRLGALNSIQELNLSAISTLNKLTITACPQLQTLTTPKSIRKEVSLSSLNKIEKLDFSPLSTLDELNINNCPRVQTIVGPKAIEQKISLDKIGTTKLALSGTQRANKYELSRSNATQITLTDLSEVTDFTLRGNQLVEDLQVPDLTSVGVFTMNESNALKTFNFPKLATINDKLIIQGASWKGNADKCLMNHLDGFLALTQAPQIAISNAGHLTDYSGLKNVVHAVEPQNWVVKDNKYNPTHQDMLDGKYTEN